MPSVCYFFIYKSDCGTRKKAAAWRQARLLNFSEGLFFGDHILQIHKKSIYIENNTTLAILQICYGYLKVFQSFKSNDMLEKSTGWWSILFMSFLQIALQMIAQWYVSISVIPIGKILFMYIHKKPKNYSYTNGMANQSPCRWCLVNYWASIYLR